MICNKCKSRLPNDSEFCQYCGNSLSVLKSQTISYSLSDPDEKPTQTKYGDFYTLGSDVMYKGSEVICSEKETEKPLCEDTSEHHYSLSYADEKPVTRTNGDIFGWEIMPRDTQSPTPIVEENKSEVPIEAEITQKEETTTKTVVAVETKTPPTKQKKIKPDKYCSRCGSLIDRTTKKCTGCGKQYFKGIKINRFFLVVLVLVVLLLTSLVFNFVQLIYISDVETEVNDLQNYIIEQKIYWIKKTSDLQNDVDELNDQISENKALAKFVDKYVVFVEDDGTNLYHKFGCDRFKGNDFLAYNVNAAKYRDYTPCELCHQ